MLASAGGVSEYKSASAQRIKQGKMVRGFIIIAS
jgi:hypothetical protein